MYAENILLIFVKETRQRDNQESEYMSIRTVVRRKNKESIFFFNVIKRDEHEQK